MGQIRSKYSGTVIKSRYDSRSDQSQAELFKLKMDHFEEIFDWLSLQDLLALGQTCKRMQHIVGYYITTKYTAVKFESTFDGIKIRNYDYEINLNGLSSFVRKLWLPYLELDLDDNLENRMRPPWRWEFSWKPQKYIIPHMKADQFKSLSEMQFRGVVLTEAGIDRMKDVLGQLKTVKLISPRFRSNRNKDFYECFLKFCTNLVNLCIRGSSNTSIVCDDNSWFRRKYPKLKHFDLIMNGAGPIVELETFFKQNTNVKTFATNVEVISANSDALKNTKIKLDILSVEFCHANTLHSSRDLLNDLYERGLFKELHVYFSTKFNPESVDTLIPFKGLAKLYIDGMRNGTDLSPLTNLKQLYINRASRIKNMNTLAAELINLEFIQFRCAYIDDILPFVRHSRKLAKIAVSRLFEIGQDIPNVEELNRERLELSNARKVTIYVKEPVYLTVKWANNQTESSLVEIRRGESYDGLNHNFDYLDVRDTAF